jgi:uncharacterized membrane protein SpoIIM required for sporulation
MPMGVVVLCVAASFVLGWSYVAKYPFAQGTFQAEAFSALDFQFLSRVSFLPSPGERDIVGHNVRFLLTAGFLAVISLGALAVLWSMVPFAVLGFFIGQAAWLGYNPLVFAGTFVLPHGLFEIPAVILASAFALRLGASVTAPREGLTVGEALVAATADFLKVFLFLVVPLLLIAAFAEARLTPQIVHWIWGG